MPFSIHSPSWCYPEQSGSPILQSAVFGDRLGDLLGDDISPKGTVSLCRCRVTDIMDEDLKCRPVSGKLEIGV